MVELVFGTGVGNQSAKRREGRPGIAGVPRPGHDLLRLQLEARLRAGLAVQVGHAQHLCVVTGFHSLIGTDFQQVKVGALRQGRRDRRREEHQKRGEDDQDGR